MEKRKYVRPYAELIRFEKFDIITDSQGQEENQGEEP